MSWAEIKKAVNSDLSTPLNSKIDAQATTLANKFGLTLVERTRTASTGNASFSKTFNKTTIAFIWSTGATIWESNQLTETVYGGSNMYVRNGFIILEPNRTYNFSLGVSALIQFYQLGGGI